MTTTQPTPILNQPPSTNATETQEVAPGNAMAPVMVAPMMSVPGMTGGIARLEKGRHKVSNWTHWYGEVVYVTQGTGNLTASVPPFVDSKTYHLNVGDFFYIPVSTRVSFEATSQEPFEFFFAIPAD